MRASLIIGFVAAAVALTAGCGALGGAADDGDAGPALVAVDAGPSSPLDAPNAQPAGSPLGDELVVPDGTELLGTRFPEAAGPFGDPEEGAWNAVLLIVGDDPFPVLQDLVDQAEAAGYEVRSRRDMCLVRDGVLECGFDADEGRVDYSFELRWGRRHGEDLRHVRVGASEGEYFTLGGGSSDSFVGVPAGTELPPAPRPLDEWEEPEPGDPVGADLRNVMWTGSIGTDRDDDEEILVVLEPGGRAAPPAYETGPYGGYHVVVTLDRDLEPDDVVADYAEQFEALGFGGQIDDGTFEGRPFVAASYDTGQSGSSGASLQAVAVEAPDGGRWYLLLHLGYYEMLESDL